MSIITDINSTITARTQSVMASEAMTDWLDDIQHCRLAWTDLYHRLYLDLDNDGLEVKVFGSDQEWLVRKDGTLVEVDAYDGRWGAYEEELPESVVEGQRECIEARVRDAIKEDVTHAIKEWRKKVEADKVCWSSESAIDAALRGEEVWVDISGVVQTPEEWREEAQGPGGWEEDQPDWEDEAMYYVVPNIPGILGYDESASEWRNG